VGQNQIIQVMTDFQAAVIAAVKTKFDQLIIQAVIFTLVEQFLDKLNILDSAKGAEMIKNSRCLATIHGTSITSNQ
jgi:hypothetical protein